MPQEPPPPGPSPPPPPSAVHTVCCHNTREVRARLRKKGSLQDLGGVDTLRKSYTLLTKNCTRLWQNCSDDGCVENTEGLRVCDCTDNILFWVLAVGALIGGALGLHYLPKTDGDDVAVADGEDPTESGTIGFTWTRNNCIGGVGHGMWMGFFVYCAYRSWAPTASAQLDKYTCRPRQARGALRGGGGATVVK